MTNLAEVQPDHFANYPAPASYDAQTETQVPLYEILHRASAEAAIAAKPSLRMALSEIRDDLERRTREWRTSAKVVEQTLQQLAIAEGKRSEAFDALLRIEADVAQSGQQLTMALSSFDETGESKNIAPRFAQSEQALLDLDKVTSNLLAAQNCCRFAWNAYADALAAEERLRQDVQIASLAN
ncbi:hypothetical protein IZ6_22320 [Terrihabitans soli]|uniref:Uncharacterized protein n=1 Tax=Terrihabitans soli TaxID=708113 RepID=A0A6S6QU85_9HYPH|nr:hypothetical protein [Terrihabitans soli]BCJ91497.1 hypothetical protein IZ6_22320 [Terrihabitans soli]